MSQPLRILLTNLTLAARTGTELWIKEAALGLRRRGHAPMVYTPDPGPIAQEIRAATIPVVDHPGRLGVRPDLIHGHHHQPTMAALLQFPGVPALFVAHDWLSWNDAPPLFPRILRYVAVDWTNRDRLIVESAIPEERVRVLLNWVDLERFRPRGPLPARPRRALVFSNTAADDTYLPVVREACHRVGLELDVVGERFGRPVAQPEKILGTYDLVFAKARSALESLAVGAAVVLCDAHGLGPLVTSAGLDELRRLNLGLRALREPLTSGGLEREIARYDTADAAEVSRRVRQTAGLEPALDQLLGLYDEVLAEAASHGAYDPEAERAAVASYLNGWTAGMQRELREHRDLRAQLQAQLQALRAEHSLLPRLQRELREHRDLHTQLQAQLQVLRAEHTQITRLQRDLDYVLASATWRLRERLLRLPGIRALYRRLRPSP